MAFCLTSQQNSCDLNAAAAADTAAFCGCKVMEESKEQRARTNASYFAKQYHGDADFRARHIAAALAWQRAHPERRREQARAAYHRAKARRAAEEGAGVPVSKNEGVGHRAAVAAAAVAAAAVAAPTPNEASPA
jgi:hypothetical protein